ncbi:polyprenyl synthetase family protein [Streptomyces bohaiensis]|uniref:polyprenyl synthetase family protein n=1 Tax=Streptomyces bohaiensis TaxID=1431344 RepID=UPI003B80A786
MTSADPAAREAARLLDRCRAEVRPDLVDAVGRLHPWLAEMAGYAFGWCEVGGAARRTADGGKGVRQALAVLGAEAAGAPARRGAPAAVAAELVHVFSLLHDDVMDGDLTRRQRDTVWRAYGTGPAVLTGDALFALAVETVARPRDTGQGAATVRMLSGALGDLVRGQADDLLFSSRPWAGEQAVRVDEYLAMAEGKTGALLGCAAAMGAAMGGAAETASSALDRAGRSMGVAFQLADDVLGLWGDPAVTGKPVHGDLRERRKTYPVLAALRSETPAGRALRTVLERDGDPAEAAALAEEAGGRTAALAEAHRHLAAARSALSEPTLGPRAVRELTALAEYAVRRHR